MKNQNSIYIKNLNLASIDEEQFELVEIKGEGHPDRICDEIADYLGPILLKCEIGCASVLNKVGIRMELGACTDAIW